jgi:hypothetical protein
MKKIIFLCFTAIPFAFDGYAQFSINAGGVLTEYTGPGGDVILPGCVTGIGEEAFEDVSYTVLKRKS